MNAVFTPTPIRISVERYQKMVETGVLTRADHVELIEGEIVSMAPIGTRHTGKTTRLIQLFSRHAGGLALVTAGAPVDLGDFSEPEPDLMLLKPRSDFYESKHARASDVLLLVEVSESSLKYDQTKKAALYARYGITEHWIVDVAGAKVWVSRGPSERGYANVQSFSDLDAVMSPMALPKVTLRIADLFD